MRHDQKFKELNIVLDGPPGPEAGRFVEVEDGDGNSFCAGTWHKREDGTYVLRILVEGGVLGKHTHAAGTMVGQDIDECALCGCDIRDNIHSGM